MAKQKIKPRGLKKLNIGGGGNAKADYDSMIDDGYHAMDDEGMAKKAYKNLKGTGMNPPSPGDVQNELRKRVPKKETPIRMYKTPLKVALKGDQDLLPENLADLMKLKKLNPKNAEAAYILGKLNGMLYFDQTQDGER